MMLAEILPRSLLSQRSLEPPVQSSSQSPSAASNHGVTGASRGAMTLPILAYRVDQ